MATEELNRSLVDKLAQLAIYLDEVRSSRRQKDTLGLDSLLDDREIMNFIDRKRPLTQLRTFMSHKPG